MLRSVKAFEQHRLVAHDTGCSVGRRGINAPSIHVDLGPGDEQSARSVHGIQPSEVQVPAVHHVKGACLDRHEVEHVDLVLLAVADVDKRRDCASQIQQRMQLDCALGTAK